MPHIGTQREISAVSNQWQPIETAPKDGTRILAYGLQTWDGSRERGYGGRMVQQVVYWRASMYTDENGVNWMDGDYQWWEVDTVSMYCETLEATHWMPLPAHPTP